MRCPPDVADVLVEIIRLGILQIRAFSKDARRCMNEADHIHNLPGLLNNYAPQLLDFYWNVERPLLIQQVSREACVGFEPAWQRLESLVQRECQPSNPTAVAAGLPFLNVPPPQPLPR